MSSTQCKKHSYKIVRLLEALQRSHFLLCRSQRAVFKGGSKAVCLFSDRYCGLGRDPHFAHLPEVSIQKRNIESSELNLIVVLLSADRWR